MTKDTCDPFDLPSSFDPLKNEAPPPPRRRRGAEPAAAEPVQRGGGGAGERLAHLLAPPAGAARLGNGPDDMPARIEALEAEIAVLTARLDGLNTLVTHRLGQQQEWLITAVTALIDARLYGRR